MYQFFDSCTNYGGATLQEQVTISFVGTAQIKNLLEQWAKQEDRSISATLRQILEREAQRRESAQNGHKRNVA